MVCTSDTFQGQVYIPAANWGLMILTIIIVAAFSNLENLTNAYGFAVATVMGSTSILLGISMYYVKGWPWIIGVGYIIIFFFFDALFWGAAFKKVPHGAWVPLIIGVILVISMLFWTWGKGLEDGFDKANRKNLRHFIQEHGSDSMSTIQDAEKDAEDHATGDGVTEIETPQHVVIDTATAGLVHRIRGVSYMSRYKVSASSDPNEMIEERRELQRISTCAIFHKFTRGYGVPHTFVGFIRQWPALPRVVVFLSICVVPVARVQEDDRYVVRKVRSVEGMYGVTYYLGFREEFNIDPERLSDQLCMSEMLANPKPDKAWLEEIRNLVLNATHIVPHYHVVSKRVEGGFLSPVVNYVRKWLIEEIYRRLATVFPQTANWLTPADEIIRIGINAFV